MIIESDSSEALTPQTLRPKHVKSGECAVPGMSQLSTSTAADSEPGL